MTKRTSLMVAYDILKIATEGSTKTNLVYQGNLNFKVVKRWLAKLIAKGLLEVHDLPYKFWKTTEKGLEFIDEMDRVLLIWGNDKMNVKMGLIHLSIPNTIPEKTQ